MIDNVLWSGRPANSEATDADTVAIREFNVAVHKDERVELSLLSVGDGLTLARKHLFHVSVDAFLTSLHLSRISNKPNLVPLSVQIIF